jgi:hypothetical protein
VKKVLRQNDPVEQARLSAKIQKRKRKLRGRWGYLFLFVLMGTAVGGSLMPYRPWAGLLGGGLIGLAVGVYDIHKAIITAR